MYALYFTHEADEQLKAITSNPGKASLTKQIKKTLGYLQVNPRHPSLNTHPYSLIPNPLDPSQKVFEAYAQNNTPSAYRIFWCYGPAKNQITILAITPHP